MTDSALQRVWDSREAISRRCDYDSRKLVAFYQSRRKKDDRTGSSSTNSDSKPTSESKTIQG